MRLTHPSVYTGYSLDEMSRNLERLKENTRLMNDIISMEKSRLTTLSFEAGVIQGERDAVAFALRDIILNMNGDLLAVFKKHHSILEKVLHGERY